MLRHTLLGIGITLVIIALVLSLDVDFFALDLQKENIITEKEIIKEARRLGMTFPGESYSHEDINLKKNFNLAESLASLEKDNNETKIKGEESKDKGILLQNNNEVQNDNLKVGASKSTGLASELSTKNKGETDPVIEEDVEKVQEDNDATQEKFKEELTRQLKEQLKEELKKEIKEELEQENKKILVTIPKGISSREVATLLIHQGVIEDRHQFIVVADKLNLETKIKAGTYSFQLPISAKEVLLQLTSNN